MVVPSIVRKSSYWITLLCLLVGGLLYGLFVINGKNIDKRRLEEIRISHVEIQCNRLAVVLDDRLEGVGDGAATLAAAQVFGRIRGGIESDLAQLSDPGQEATVAAVRRAYHDLLSKTLAELSAIEQGDLKRARELDIHSVNPALAYLQFEASNLAERSHSDAGRAINLIQSLGTVFLLLGAIAIAILQTWHQKKVLALHDIDSERKAAVQNERTFRSLVRNTASVIAVVDHDGKLQLVSEASDRLWGWKPKQLIGRSIYDGIHSDDRPILAQAITQSRDGHDSDQTEVRIHHGSGDYKTFQVHVADLSTDPDLHGLLLTFHDLTERKRLEAELLHHAFHDRLTGLPNRALFMDRLAHRLRGREGEKTGAVFFLDLDNFKVINDSLGHEAGDELLKRVSERLEGACRPIDTVARIGGDDFTVLLEDIGSTDEAVATAERLIAALSGPVPVAGREVFVTVSVGVALHLGWSDDSESLMRNADIAMYQAKALGKNGYAVYDPTMNEFAVERLELESELRHAVEREEFTLHYQPIVNIMTGEIFEVEALIRWNHPTRGQIPPLKFIPIAEETGLVSSIGRWVLRQASVQLRVWDNEQPQARPLVIAINVSAKQVQEPGFAREVCGILRELDLDPSRIELEVTETAMLKDLDRMSSVLAQLRTVGVRIAIDDFGTGYSSFSYLSRLPVDTLKIDRSFVISLGRDDRTTGVIQAMVTMAKALGLRVISEGIENPAQLGALQNIGCDFGQGYLFAKPLEASVMGEHLGAKNDHHSLLPVTGS